MQCLYAQRNTFINKKKKTAKPCKGAEFEKKPKKTSPFSVGTMARARALLSSIADALGAMSFNPCTKDTNKVSFKATLTEISLNPITYQ